MALVKCLDCSKEISDSAPTCPNCGRPMAKAEEEKKASPLITAGLATAIAGGVMYFTNFGVLSVVVLVAGGAMFLVGMLTPAK